MNKGGLTLNPRWRERIEEIGLQAFVTEEMLKLGFWKPDEHLPPGATREAFVEHLQRSAVRLQELNRSLRQVEKQIAEVGDVKSILREIRARRIERVKKEREERKARKAKEQEKRRAADARRRQEKPPFLGHGVSARLLFEGGDNAALKALDIPLLHDVTELEAAMDCEPGKVAWLGYHRKAIQFEHYVRFEVPKRRGGTRVISAPKPTLKAAQAWINENILRKVPPEPPATAFRPRTSILDNAKAHCAKGVVLRFDLENFFPTVTYPRIRGLFESLGYNPGIASVLALLCTEAPRVQAEIDGQTWYVATGQRRLPQGAPTSPALSNLVTRRLDRRLSGLANAADRKWTYTRYADDMVFSHPDRDASLGALMRGIHAVVENEGFVINKSKTAVMRQPHRQIVTGLIVNDEPRIPRKRLRQYRAFLHQCTARGFDKLTSELGVDAKSYARGYCAFVNMVMPAYADKLRSEHAWLDPAS